MTDIDATAAGFQTSLSIEPGSWLDRVRRERQALQEQEQAELAELDTPEARLEEWFEEERAISAALRRRSGRSRRGETSSSGSSPSTPGRRSRRTVSSTPGRQQLGRDDVVSVSTAVSALPWRRADAFRWLKSSGLVAAGPDGRECVRWSDVLDALEPDQATAPTRAPSAKAGRPRQRASGPDPWDDLPAVDLSSRYSGAS